MKKPKSVSIIIPLTRPTAYLKEILTLESKKAEWIEFILIIDNPNSNFIEWVQNIADEKDKDIKIIINEKNIGAPKSRNKGIEVSEGELILFLDDDVIPEKDLIDHHIEELTENYFGVIGTTIMNFSETNLLEYAVKKSGFNYSFRLFEDYKEHTWGPTCNVSFLKEKISDIRFDNFYPKAGGGEDVDFCWDIGIKNQQKMKVSEKATAIHPPWKGIKSNFRRFRRWGYADAILFRNHKWRRFRDWPNYLEFNFLLTIITIILGATINYWIFIQLPLHLVFSFLLSSLYQSYDCECGYKAGILIESFRIWHHLGRLQKIITSFRLHHLLYRTQYFDNYTPRKMKRKTLAEFILILISYILTISTLLILVYYVIT